MKVKGIMVLLVLISCGAGLLFAGGGTQAGSSGAKEATVPKLYPSTFTPTGTLAADYQDKIKYFSDNFVKFFTDRGEATKILGYETPLRVTTSAIDSAGMQTSLALWKEQHGETADMHRYFDIYKRAFNIEFSNHFTASSTDYNQALRLNMAANDLPDIFRVGVREDLLEMSQAGIIHDLTPYREKYSSEIVEEMWEGSPLIDMSTIDGKLYGLPQSWPATDPLSYLWIRGDWLEALNLPIPKTMDELAMVIDAFMKSGFNKSGRESIGIAFGKNVLFLNRGLFTGFGAYPEFWIEKNGSLIWGGVDENNKRALAYMNDLYKRGWVDKEFITYTDTDMLESIISGRCGIFYSPHWVVSNAVIMTAQEASADLWAIPLPTIDGKPAVSPIAPANVGFTVVNSKFANPEIAFKMFNLFAFNYLGRDGTWWGFNSPPGGSNVNDLTQFARLYSPWLNYDAFESLTESFNHGWDPQYINAAADLYWGSMQNPATAWGWNRLSGPELPHPAFRRLKEIVDENRYFYDAYTGLPSTFMRDRWQTIQDEQLAIFTKIITGDLEVNAGFDEWIRTFNSLGGEQITREVNDWFRTR